MRRMTIRRRALLALLLIHAVAPARELAEPSGIPPCASVQACARLRGIALAGFELAGSTDAERDGDRLTVLFTIEDGAGSRQWLTEIRAAGLTEREAKSKPGSGLGLLSVFQSSLKTDTGHEFSFVQSPAALELRTYGPFVVDGKPVAPGEAGVTARVLATREFLAHGLAPMAEIELGLRAAGKQNPGLSFLFRPRFSDGQMAAARARALAAGFSEDDERHYAEGLFALVQFANLAFKTAGVGPVTQELLDSPTLFSGAYVNLVWPAVQLTDGSGWGLPGARVFRLPYSFQSKTQAKGTLFLTAPRPPLHAMAGIVGLTIDESSKTATKRLVVRVLAGRRGAPSP